MTVEVFAPGQDVVVLETTVVNEVVEVPTPASTPEVVEVVNQRGPQGLQGDLGPQGDQGEVGPNGLTAYEVAALEGFVGDEAAWLASLVGPQGDQGDTGPEGPSAYEVAVANGFVGTEAEWLDDLIGPPGESIFDGLWDPATTYGVLDLVSHNGRIWQSLVDPNLNIEPVQGASWNLVYEGPDAVALQAAVADHETRLDTLEGHIHAQDPAIADHEVRIGTLETAPAPATSLDALTDVDLTGAIDGEVLGLVAGVWVPVEQTGGGGGHVIEDAAGTDLTQRANLQFIGATVTDDAANNRTLVTISSSGTGSTGQSDAIDTAERTSGNRIVNSSVMAAMDTSLDLVVPAIVGDIIEYEIEGRINGEGADFCMDVATLVGGVLVSYFHTGTNVPNDHGNSALFQQGGRYDGISATAARQLTAADISAGTVTLRLMTKTTTGASRTVLATSADPFRVRAKNISRVFVAQGADQADATVMGVMF